MRRLGSQVTIIQHVRHLLPQEDPDMSDALLELMRDEGVEVLLEAEVLNVAGRSGTGVQLQVRVGASQKSLDASDILVAAGRTPNTDSLDAAKANVRLDSQGYIQVNERLQTSAPTFQPSSGKKGTEPLSNGQKTTAKARSQAVKNKTVKYCSLLSV